MDRVWDVEACRSGPERDEPARSAGASGSRRAVSRSSPRRGPARWRSVDAPRLVVAATVVDERSLVLVVGDDDVAYLANAAGRDRLQGRWRSSTQSTCASAPATTGLLGEAGAVVAVALERTLAGRAPSRTGRRRSATCPSRLTPNAPLSSDRPRARGRRAERDEQERRAHRAEQHALTVSPQGLSPTWQVTITTPAASCDIAVRNPSSTASGGAIPSQASSSLLGQVQAGRAAARFSTSAQAGWPVSASGASTSSAASSGASSSAAWACSSARVCAI